MRQLNAKILENKKVVKDFYKIRIESSYLGKFIKPGQFIEVRCSDSINTFLRRPFSAHRILKGGIEILYEIIGKGTEELSQRKAGEALDVIGPLGSGFNIERTAYSAQRTAILVAGGMGVAPLVALAEAIVHRTSYIVHREKVYVFIGAKRDGHILCEQEFKSLGCEVMVVTEDGSQGEKGLVTDLLKSLRSTNDERRTTIYACGPNEMLKEVARIAQARRIHCQVSLEERMACGVGACLGCPVKVRGGEYKMVCKDGPIFDSEEIAW